MSDSRMQAAAVFALLLMGTLSASAFDWEDYRAEDYEEPAGAMVAFEFNPVANVYGFGLGDATWLKHTPVLGDFRLSMLYNDIEGALYGSVGMTLRLMPHWRVAPFVGAGGSYNYPISGSSSNSSSSAETSEKGNAYWGGNMDAGVRVQGRVRFYEVLGRYTWSSSAVKDADYWSVCVGYGFLFGKD